ncbi:MAG: polysaccharide deacetylase family protein [Bacteroidia bacterium]|nr:polysaccharide deacetylase family protein [Bacteroidia bacterium]HQV01077.1 polysaccharide deacetylase family protein [Bacteroidia bacterium]
MIPVQPPYLLQKCFGSLLWRIEEKQKVLYLTFDDGPIPQVTPFVLDTLAKYQAKATFFCIGDNVRKHQQIYNDVINQKHVTANHTYNHISGWETTDFDYLKNIKQAGQLISSNYFRPPYGRITPSQIRMLKHNYKIVMWDVLSMDYKLKITGMQCYMNVKKHARPGSIIVFHDSLKAFARLKIALPATLKHFSDAGYIFKALPLHQL